MKHKMNWIENTLCALALCAALTGATTVLAQDDSGPFGHRAPSCSIGTASGTYGYRMAGQIVGVGPFLVNGIFTHYPDGTMDGDVQLVVGAQSFPAPATDGKWTVNSDCTGTGKFKVAALNLDVTYNFIATDGGEQIDLLNTNPGVVLHGYGRRISKAGKAPSCNNGSAIGAYGYRLDGSLPNVSLAAIAGTITNSVTDSFEGVTTGSDTFNAMGQYLPRTLNGTYKVGENCRGTGVYTDSLGNQVNYVFTLVDKGETIFLMGIDPGTAVSGVGRRIK
jgi:hypothetical protein